MSEEVYDVFALSPEPEEGTDAAARQLIRELLEQHGWKQTQQLIRLEQKLDKLRQQCKTTDHAMRLTNKVFE